ncbi:MAG: hypothetical protein ACD_75C02504G0002 [uncultured bacterium]|nr:MAG: hypothetical protein ACD_75C02504G0002 [uncultured bacterium]
MSLPPERGAFRQHQIAIKGEQLTDMIEGLFLFMQLAAARCQKEDLAGLRRQEGGGDRHIVAEQEPENLAHIHQIVIGYSRPEDLHGKQSLNLFRGDPAGCGNLVNGEKPLLLLSAVIQSPDHPLSLLPDRFEVVGLSHALTIATVMPPSAQ